METPILVEPVTDDEPAPIEITCAGGFELHSPGSSN